MNLVRSGMVWVAVLSLLAPLARAEEHGQQVDNPAYSAWSSYGIGSSETLDAKVNANGHEMNIQTTRKLVEKTDDYVKIEINSTMTMVGQNHDLPTQTMTVPAKMEKKDVKALGTEDVQAAGKTFSCKVFEVTELSSRDPEDKARIWVSPDVPGGVVKMEASSQHGTMTSTLKSFEKK